MVTIRERIANFLAPPAPSRPSAGIIATPQSDWNGFYGIPGMLAANPDKVLELYGQGSLELYRAILSDPQAQSAFQQRRLAVIQRPWEVEPGAEDARAKKAADALREQIAALDWDSISNKMLYGVWYGYGVAEIDWQPDGGMWAFGNIVVPRRERFGFTNEGELRLLTRANSMTGEAVPDRKFWVFRSGAENDHEWHGTGLAHYCYWPWFFKRGGWRYWSRYLEKYSAPTAVGKYPSHLVGDASDTARAAKAALLAAVRAFHVETGITISDDTAIELVEAKRNGAADYQAFKRENDSDITKVILSQTMTTEAGPAGLGSGQANVHDDVKESVVRSDADMLSSSFNRGPVRWWTDFNFGPDVAAPTLYRVMEDPDDVDTVADRDTKLHAMGWQRTEESFHEVYGEGYESKPVPEALDGGDDEDDEKPKGPLFAALADPDVVDRLVEVLSEPGQAAFADVVEIARDALAGAGSLDAARIALLDVLERMDEAALGEVLAKAGIAVRAGEQAGIEVV